MDKLLNQDEIDALFRAAQGRSAEPAAEIATHRNVSPCNFRQAGQISREHLRAVSLLHDNFARSLTHSLGAFLRVPLEVNLVSVEQLTFGEFLRDIPEVNYVASVKLQPLEALAALEVDLSLASPMVDLLLGGTGKPEPTVRDVTEIEEEILESVVSIFCREMQNTWNHLLALEFIFDQRQRQAQVLQLMPPNERVLCLSFELHMPEVRGTLKIAFPTVVSNGLLRKIGQQGAYRKHTGPSGGTERLQRQLEKCLFPLELVLPACTLPSRQLLNLEPGQVLILGRKVSEPAALQVSGRKMFLAYPVRSANQRAAGIQRRLSLREVSSKESQ